jgi:hypothetical protein
MILCPTVWVVAQVLVKLQMIRIFKKFSSVWEVSSIFWGDSLLSSNEILVFSGPSLVTLVLFASIMSNWVGGKDVSESSLDC